MFQGLAIAALIAYLSLVTVKGAAADAPTPLTVYGNLPTLEDLAISPDGTKLAYIRAVGDQRISMYTCLAMSGHLPPLRSVMQN